MVFAFAQIAFERVSFVSGNGGSNNFGSANTTANIHSIHDSARHHSTGKLSGAKDKTIPPQLATFMGIMDNSMDNLASAVTNNKTLMDTLVTNNKCSPPKTPNSLPRTLHFLPPEPPTSLLDPPAHVTSTMPYRTKSARSGPSVCSDRPTAG